jgi:hypothetical protein
VRRDTGGNYRIFTVDSGTTVSLSGLTISNGYLQDFDGGGIFNSGTLTLNNATVSGNSTLVAGSGGGGIANVYGTLTLNNSTVSGNFTPTYFSVGGGIINYQGTVALNNSTVSGNFANEGGGIANSDGGTLTLTHSTVSGNTSIAAGGGILNVGDNLTLDNSVISGNAADYGGGIDNQGPATLNNCTVSDNGGNVGGGILNGDTLTLNNCTVSDNVSGGGICDDYTDGGGGIENDRGTLTVNNSTVSGNFADFYCVGGGINNQYGQVTLNNSTVSGNGVFGFGGGIENRGTLTLINATISSNSADCGGGIDNSTYGGGTLHTRNTIIAGNLASTAPDLSGNLGSLGHNLIDNDSGGSGFDSTDLRNVNSLLSPLQDNGGPTRTMALLPGSPALNAGDPSQLGVGDQRGVVRSGGVNIGAYQASASAFVVSVSGTVASGTPFDVTVQAVDAFGQVAFGYTGTVIFSVTDPDPAVVLPADYSFTADDQGTHTFTGGFTLITPGAWNLTVADLANGLSQDVMLTVNP